MTSHIVVQDPQNLSSRFSNQDRLGYDIDEEMIDDIIRKKLSDNEEESSLFLYEDGITGKVSESINYSVIERYLDRIPPREADIIKLYFKDRMKQEQIAKLFRITQAAVSYRLHRGIKRIQFLITIPELDKDLFDLELGPKFCDQDREILWRMYETTCQSKIAKLMSLTQGRVRHRFFRALEKIRQLMTEEAREKQIQLHLMRKQGKSEEEIENLESEIGNDITKSRHGKYYTVFFAISDKHFNILNEVSLPQFMDRSDAQLLTIE